MKDFEVKETSEGIQVYLSGKEIARFPSKETFQLCTIIGMCEYKELVPSRKQLK